jgi:hypothetical protein
MDKCLTLSSYLKKVPTTKTEINWWELSPSHPVVLDPHYQKKILDRAVKKAGSYTLLGTAIKIPRQALSACHRLRRPPSLGYLKRILQYLEADYGEANNDILEIARLKNPKLPFKLNTPEGAEVMAAFLSDGHIPKESIKNPMYCAYEKELHLRLIRVCKNIFGAFDAHIKMGHKSLITRFPVPIGKSLVLGGVPAGSKVVKNPFLPRSIIEGNEKIRTAYLRRVFDDEGDVHLSASKKAVRLT